jgi:transposase
MSCSTPAPTDWAAFAAIDWGSRQHAWSLLPAQGGSVQSGVLRSTPEAVELWAMELYQRFSACPIAVAVEQKRGPLVYMLGKYDHLVLHPVPPTMSASYRRAFIPSGAKSDPGDAQLLLDLLLHHRERLRPLPAETEQTRLLQFLVESRRNFVQQKVDAVLRLTACVEQYFPQLRTWFGKLDTPLVADLLRRWPVLSQLQRCHPGTLRRFLVTHGSRKEELIQQRIQLIYAAVPAVTDEVVIEACYRRAQALTRVIGVLREDIAALDKRIDAVTAEHPDASLFASFPGAGRATVPRLIAAFGTRREAYTAAGDLQSLSGIAPAKIASGNSTAIRMRRACPKFLRQTFHEFAGQSIPHSPWAKLFYQVHLRGDKKHHHAAVRALAFKWMRILYHCWKNHEPYDERKFLDAQARSPHAAGRELFAQYDPKTGFFRPKAGRQI